jgi:hypothetical protein
VLMKRLPDIAMEIRNKMQDNIISMIIVYLCVFVGLMLVYIAHLETHITYVYIQF